MQGHVALMIEQEAGKGVLPLGVEHVIGKDHMDFMTRGKGCDQPVQGQVPSEIMFGADGDFQKKSVC